jgi:transcriptional regulator with XRE-family HTH domain
MLDKADLQMFSSTLTVENIEYAVGLVRKGDRSSLAILRQKLGIPAAELSNSLGLAEAALNDWENGVEKPASNQMIAWRLKMGDILDARISSYLKTNNKELITQFWEIMWRLNDLKASSK